MKNYKSLLALAVLTFVSCLGDKKNVDIYEMSDRGFINESFAGNKINFSDDMSACRNIDVSEIAKVYGVDPEMVMIMDSSDQDLKRDARSPISCQFYIKSGKNDYEWLRGSMTIQREIKSDEYMGDVAEATGTGENWQEAWALKKSMSNSAEWISGLGKAALWNPNNNLLEVKFDGYNLLVSPLKNKMNQAEESKNRDYKSVALEMVKAAGYTD